MISSFEELALADLEWKDYFMETDIPGLYAGNRGC